MVHQINLLNRTALGRISIKVVELDFSVVTNQQQVVIKDQPTSALRAIVCLRENGGIEALIKTLEEECLLLKRLMKHLWEDLAETDRMMAPLPLTLETNSK